MKLFTFLFDPFIPFVKLIVILSIVFIQGGLRANTPELAECAKLIDYFADHLTTPDAIRLTEKRLIPIIEALRIQQKNYRRKHFDGNVNMPGKLSKPELKGINQAVAAAQDAFDAHVFNSIHGLMYVTWHSNLDPFMSPRFWTEPFHADLAFVKRVLESGGDETDQGLRIALNITQLTEAVGHFDRQYGAKGSGSMTPLLHETFEILERHQTSLTLFSPEHFGSYIKEIVHIMMIMRQIDPVVGPQKDIIRFMHAWQGIGGMVPSGGTTIRMPRNPVVLPRIPALVHEATHIRQKEWKLTKVLSLLSTLFPGRSTASETKLQETLDSLKIHFDISGWTTHSDQEALEVMRNTRFQTKEEWRKAQEALAEIEAFQRQINYLLSVKDHPAFFYYAAQPEYTTKRKLKGSSFIPGYIKNILTESYQIPPDVVDHLLDKITPEDFEALRSN
jgi:hypothetical protein